MTLHLSVPHMSGREMAYVQEAFTSNWLSTVGPHVTAFEAELSGYVGAPTVAVSSGTAAIHLGLRLLGVCEGDLVLCSTLTFVASANPILYLGAAPIFIDSDHKTWNMDPNILGDALADCQRRGMLPKAVVVVDLYGQCADFDPIRALCRYHGVPILEDATESLGAFYKGQPAGTLGDVGTFSFNGNKIITTAGGGALVCRDQTSADRARFWATQARDPGIAYEHSESGYNFRLSNVLAAIGRGQLSVLNLRVEQRRAVALRYRTALADLPSITFMPQADYGLHTNWLSCVLVADHPTYPSRDAILTSLRQADIEARPLWKPMHMQRLFSGAPRFGGMVAEYLFRHGLCLPSSSNLTALDQLAVVNNIRRLFGEPLFEDWEQIDTLATPS